MVLFALLFSAWMLPGVIGRTPWKADESYTVGLVLNIYETGDWVVPRLGADPFMEKPPIFFMTAAVFARLLSPWLEFHEAARGACVFYLALTLWFIALASRRLNGSGTGWVAALFMLGCLGNVHFAHMLVTDNALLTGFALGLYGLSLSLRRPWLAGLLCGTGAGLSFLSKGLLGPGVMGAAVLPLPIFCQAWRTRDYWRLLGGIFLAVTPWVVVWPLLLYRHSPDLFMTWFWDNNGDRFLGQGLGHSDRTPLYYLKELPVFALLPLPFAGWQLWKKGRAGLRDPNLQLPLVYFLAIFLVLSLAGQKRSNYTPPMFVPLCLLGVGGLSSLGQDAVQKLNRFLFWTFSLVAGFLWFGWLAQFTGHPSIVRSLLEKRLPGFDPTFHGGIFGVALAATLAWVAWLIWHRKESGFITAHWAAGLALVYLLAMTLWLPVSNAAHSYRRSFSGLTEALGENPGVVGGLAVGEPQRAMIHYFTGLRVVLDPNRRPPESRWMLVQGRAEAGREPEPPSSDWRSVWQGSHNDELFVLYRREP